MKRCPQTKKEIIESVGAITQTREQLCKQFGITPQTLKNWREEDPEFDAAFAMAESNCQAWERESWQKFLHTLHTIVKFVVAQSDGIVAYFAHYIYDILPL